VSIKSIYLVTKKEFYKYKKGQARDLPYNINKYSAIHATFKTKTAYRSNDTLFTILLKEF